MSNRKNRVCDKCGSEIPDIKDLPEADIDLPPMKFLLEEVYPNEVPQSKRAKKKSTRTKKSTERSAK